MKIVVDTNVLVSAIIRDNMPEQLVCNFSTQYGMAGNC